MGLWKERLFDLHQTAGPHSVHHKHHTGERLTTKHISKLLLSRLAPAHRLRWGRHRRGRTGASGTQKM
jgi:hypothetical protein